MKVIHLYHSGFWLEHEHCVWLFDYYRGNIPEADRAKKRLIFCSHKHQDHFNPEIFSLFREFPETEYILAKDIPVRPAYLQRYGADASQAERIVSVRANEEYRFDDGQGEEIVLRTLRSTDAGVAFLLDYRGKRIYHAGDLNWWHWEGESKQENRNMEANFRREIEKLRGLTIDAAFVPLDPRLGTACGWGLDLLMRTARVGRVYPMHYGDSAEAAKQFLRDPVSADYRDRIVFREVSEC